MIWGLGWCMCTDLQGYMLVGRTVPIVPACPHSSWSQWDWVSLMFCFSPLGTPQPPHRPTSVFVQGWHWHGRVGTCRGLCKSVALSLLTLSLSLEQLPILGLEEVDQHRRQQGTNPSWPILPAQPVVSP